MPAQDAFRATHNNGTATTAGIKVPTKKGLGVRLFLTNTDATNSLDLSFDSGRTFFNLPQGAPTLDLPVRFHFFFLRGNGGTATYQALILEG